MGEWGWPAALCGLGAIFGSFIATLCLRWPQGLSVLHGRSRCDGCGRTLKALELVPLLSFIAQRGRCRNCGAAIDPRHFMVEGAAAMVGLLAGLAAQGPNDAAAAAVFGWLLLALTALDIAELWLPNALTATLALAGIATGLCEIAPPLEDRLLGGALGFGMLFLIAAGYRRIRGREGIGGGDPKLMGAIGLWTGWAALPMVLLVASVTGLALVLAARIAGREVAADTRVPLGALLAVAAFPVLLLRYAQVPGWM